MDFISLDQVAVLDIETRVYKRSSDLKKVGVRKMMMQPDFGFYIVSYQIGPDGELRRWMPGEPFPEDLRAHIEAGLYLAAHNAIFERLFFEVYLSKFDAPIPKLEQWLCTQYMARLNGLPASLGGATHMSGLTQKKDLRGEQLIQRFCGPSKLADGSLPTDGIEELYEYCDQDVRSTWALLHHLRMLTPREWRDFWTSERINNRGIQVDVDFAAAACSYGDEYAEVMQARLPELTDGACEKARSPKVTEWVSERVTPAQLDAMLVYKDNEQKMTLDRMAIDRLLSFDDLNPTVREVLITRAAVSRSSIGKYTKIIDHEIDGRVYDQFIAAGARSQRFTSFGIQLHNFPRKTIKEHEKYLEWFKDNVCPDWLQERSGVALTDLMSQLLRPTIMAPAGCVLIGRDFSNIEGRMLPWLANSPGAHKRLEQFRAGVDPYISAAAEIFGVPYDEVTDDQRSVGKVAELSCGYSGHVGSFMAMAGGYGLRISEERAYQVVEAWRRANQWAVEFWNLCHQAALQAVNNPGQIFPAGRLQYTAVQGNFSAGGTTLMCLLPDDTILTYPGAVIESELTANGYRHNLEAIDTLWKPPQHATHYETRSLWRGLLVENATQGAAAALLRDALFECQERGLEVIVHVHDEIVLESRQEHADADEAILRDIMETPPEWCPELPLASDGGQMLRFQKL